MRPNQLDVPYIPYDEICIRSKDFLHKYNPSDTIPVPIERIAELELGIEIIPVSGLKFAFDIEGWISNDLKTITVDLHEFNGEENRCRFTIAHEIGHLVLHREIFEQQGFSNIEEWKDLVTNFDPKQYSYLETQANIFAGLILVPGEHLKEKYDQVINKVRDEGFEIHFDSELFNQYVCRWLAQEFQVSERTMEIRLKKDGFI